MTRASWIEIVTGIGVIGSLIFVSVQIRENTSAVRGQTLQGITDQSIEVSLALATDDELGAAYGKILSGREAELSPAEENLLIFWYSAVMRVAENRFRQRALGTFHDVGTVGGGSAAYRLPFFRRWWQAYKAYYPADFAAYVDQTLIPLVQDSIPRMVPLR